MKLEVIYLQVKVVIEYDTKAERREAIAEVKAGVADISGWNYRTTKVEELTELKG